ncbi:MAG: amidohydrolase family protein [Thermaerobacter sp.]|nr:amidohydrolase family protein [Thermaerobacter sp.]
MRNGLKAWTAAAWLVAPTVTATTVLTDVDGRIVAVGDEGLIASAVHVESLGDRVASAGLWDSHLHWLGLAQETSRLDLTGATSLRDLYQRVRAASAQLAPDQVLVGAGWNQNRWGGEWPDRAGLDLAAPGRPVVLWARDHHGLVASSATFGRLWPDGEPVDPPGGRYERRGGVLTGIVRETAANELASRLPVMPTETFAAALPALVQRLLQMGLVGATGMEPDHARGALEAQLAGRQTFRGQVFLTDEGPGWTSPPSPWFRVVGAKRFLDGAVGTRTAAVGAPYADGSGEGVWRIPRDRVAAALAEAAADGAAAVAVHAIGDAAVVAALDALARIPAARSGVAHRVEHAQLMDPAAVARMARIPGVVASMQPVHLLEDRWAMEKAWPDRRAWSFPLGSLAAVGVPLLLGSDAPIETPDPVVGMQAAVWRARAGEPAWEAQEAITPWQALDGYTRAPAAADQRAGGVLAPGRWADFTVYDRDPLEALAHHEPLAVVGTVVAGRWVHRAF